MRMYDLILKKRNGAKLSENEIHDMITMYVNNEIPDYQMSAMLMAMYFKGMDKDETLYLTTAMQKAETCLIYQLYMALKLINTVQAVLETKHHLFLHLWLHHATLLLQK